MNLPFDVGAFDFAAFRFLRPWWLLGLLLLPLLVWQWQARERRRNAWRSAVDAHLLPHLLAGGEARRRLPWALLLAVAVGSLAMAGPSWRQDSLPLWQTHTPLVIALDLSEPMLANDLPPSRLLQARVRIATVLRERQGGQVGLVAYSGDAYTVAPLTDDVANIALFLDALAPDVMPDYGADLAHGDAGRAIVHARRLLQRAGFGDGDILLLTAGADAGARGEAASAAGAGFRVSVLGVGRAAGGTYARAGGGSGDTRLQADALAALASAGRGGFAEAGAGDADLRGLGVIDPGATAARSAVRGEKRLLAIDQGWWLLPPLLLLVLLLFRRGGALAVLALALALPVLPLPVHAQQAADSGTGTPDGLWRRADQRAHARQRAGEQAYRAGDYAAAEQAFAADGSARGQYNLGNALAKQGRFDEAIAAYDRALQAQPGMTDAVENRRIVEAARRQQPPQGGRQPQSPQPRQGQSNPQSGGDQQGQSSGAGDSGQQDRTQSPPRSSQPSPESRGPGNQPEPPPQSADAQQQQQQQQADAAQREQMQRALEQADGRQATDQDTPRPAETAAERERRIVNEAQLRRIPDDPGGLLRAKFRLERQRRIDGGGP